jgi:outer membrane protein assembly factor BamD
VLVLAGGLLAGCASKEVDKTANWSPNKIYAEAKDELNAGGYDNSIKLFEKLEGRAAGTPLAQQAQIEKAYAEYKNGDKALAIATLDRFMKLHPASPAYDYALYLKGVVNFNNDLGMFSFLTRQDLSERDQKAAKESFESFKELVNRFPDSRYTPDARARMTYIVNSLAQYEVHVARYYYSRGAYLAAINRAQIALSDYREVPAAEEALYLMVLSYEALGMNQLRDDSLRVLKQNYPNSEYLTQGLKAKTDPWWKFW